jgi:hypothetical protein
MSALLCRELVPLQLGSAVTGEYVVEGLTALTGLRVGIYRPVSGHEKLCKYITKKAIVDSCGTERGVSHLLVVSLASM